MPVAQYACGEVMAKVLIGPAAKTAVNTRPCIRYRL